MKKILYKDCNNNINYLKNIFQQIETFLQKEIKWSISGIDLIFTDKGDTFNGILTEEMNKIVKYQKKLANNHDITLFFSELMDLFECVKTVYEGVFKIVDATHNFTIKVFDGDIIEIEGDFEEKIKL